MKEKNNIKINLSVISLIILLIIIIIMGGIIYKFYENKQIADSKLESLNNELKLLNDKVIELQKITDSKENTVDKKSNNKQNEETTHNEIIKYELQTSEYFNNKPDINNYYIDSEKELNQFYNIYSNRLNIDKNYLENNSIFIQVYEVGSGSIKKKLSSVTFDNNTVNFVVETDTPTVGTMDMAFWYLVAIIPNERLNNLDLSNWSKPSEIR